MYIHNVSKTLAGFNCRGCLAIALACRAFCAFKPASQPLTEILAPCTWLKNMVIMCGAWWSSAHTGCRTTWP